MPFNIDSSTGDLLPEEALRHIVEALDTWRGREKAYVVFENRGYYPIISVHAEQAAAQAAVKAADHLSYVGPLRPPQPFIPIFMILKPTGCRLMQLDRLVSTVVLKDSKGGVVEEFSVRTENRPPRADDIEALFCTLYGLDRFMMPYLTNVYGAEFAAEKRDEWLKKK